MQFVIDFILANLDFLHLYQSYELWLYEFWDFFSLRENHVLRTSEVKDYLLAIVIHFLNKNYAMAQAVNNYSW